MKHSNHLFTTPKLGGLGPRSLRGGHQALQRLYSPLSRYKDGTGEASAEYRGSHADFREDRQAPRLEAGVTFHSS